MVAACNYIFGVLYLVPITKAKDYWDPDFDENKNCIREEEMTKLRGAKEQTKCTSVGGGSGHVNQTMLQWEECKKRLGKKLWLTCKPRNIEKESQKFCQNV